MYVPASFAEADRARLHDFIEQHSFATLVSSDDNGLTGSHLPLLLDRDASLHGRLVGHMARANSQWEQADGQPVLAIFHGPHAYISPTWYETPNTVPTWNYVTVHASGTFHLVSDKQRLLEIVRRTVDVYESPLPQPWSLQNADPEFVARLLDAIVGFEIDIERLEGKWKLNQNHPVERRERVIRALHAAGQHDGLRIADLMSANLNSTNT